MIWTLPPVWGISHLQEDIWKLCAFSMFLTLSPSAPLTYPCRGQDSGYAALACSTASLGLPTPSPFIPQPGNMIKQSQILLTVRIKAGNLTSC